MQHCLQQLAQTGVCDAPIFDFMTQLPAPQTQHIDCTDGVVVVEGLHAFNPILTETLPQDAVLNIYASLREEYAGPDGARLIATRDVRLARRITRDWRFRGHDADFTIACGPMSVRQRTSISRRSRIGRTLCWILRSAARWGFGNIILTS